LADKTKSLEATDKALAVNQKVVPQKAPFSQHVRLIPCYYPTPGSNISYFIEIASDIRKIVLPANPGDTNLVIGFRLHFILVILFKYFQYFIDKFSDKPS